MQAISNRSLTLFAGAILILTGIKYFVEITDDYYEHDLQRLDTEGSAFIHQFRSLPLTYAMRIITYLGDNITYLLVISLALLHYWKERPFIYLLRLLVVLLISFVLSYLIKYIIDRPRPDGIHLINVITKSYPSGHAMSAATFYPLMIYTSWKYLKRHKFVVAIISILMIILIGVSRVYLGVHHPSDVLAGFCLGMFLSGLTILLNEFFEIYARFRTERS